MRLDGEADFRLQAWAVLVNPVRLPTHHTSRVATHAGDSKTLAQHIYWAYVTTKLQRMGLTAFLCRPLECITPPDPGRQADSESCQTQARAH